MTDISETRPPLLPTRINHPLWRQYTQIGDGERAHIPFGTTAAGLVASWNISAADPSPHWLIIGGDDTGKTTALRTAAVQLARRDIPALAICARDDQPIPAAHTLRVGDDLGEPTPAGALAAAELIRALWAETQSRSACLVDDGEPTGVQLPLLSILVDDVDLLMGQWQSLLTDGDPDTRDLLTALAPFATLTQLVQLGRSAGLRVAMTATWLSPHLVALARDHCTTHTSLGAVTRDAAMALWGSPRCGRDLNDADIAGRAITTDSHRAPVSAQLWWTPPLTADRDVITGLSPADRSSSTALGALMPATAPDVRCYSSALIDALSRSDSTPHYP